TRKATVQRHDKGCIVICMHSLLLRDHYDNSKKDRKQGAEKNVLIIMLTKPQKYWDYDNTK
ncbi:MAG: hypothetical protein RR975_13730, partial [Clostridia bacterium]